MAWVSLCRGFSSAILYTGVILHFRVFPIMPSCYLLEVNIFSPLLSTAYSYYKESPSLGESSQLVELVWGRNWVRNCVLGYLDKSIAGPALLCRTALVVGFPDYCRKPPRVSVGTTNLHSVLTNQCYSLKLKHEPRLILFSSLFWFLQLPVATQWCFTANFVYNTFFFLVVCLPPVFSAPSGSKGNLFSVPSESLPQLTVMHAHGAVHLTLFMTSERVSSHNFTNWKTDENTETLRLCSPQSSSLLH